MANQKKTMSCPACHGSGYRPVPKATANPQHAEVPPVRPKCMACDGTGLVPIQVKPK
jgi:hypothetical protein